MGALDLVSVAVFDHQQTPGKCVPPETYDDRVCAVFRIVCAEQGAGASPAEVAAELKKRGWLSELDSVIDVADIMRELRDRGRL